MRINNSFGSIYWTSGIAVVFLERLEGYYEPLPAAHLFHFDQLYGFSMTTSAEIRFRFYTLVLKSEVAEYFVQGAANWVIGVDDTGVVKGRMKFCRPMFRAISKVNSDLAKSTFTQARMQFHPIAQKLIAQVRILRTLCTFFHLQLTRTLDWISQQRAERQKHPCVDCKWIILIIYLYLHFRSLQQKESKLDVFTVLSLFGPRVSD